MRARPKPFSLSSAFSNKKGSAFLIAGGSGITPIYQLALRLLRDFPNVSVILLQCDASRERAMLQDEVAQLVAAYAPRVRVRRVISADGDRLTADLLQRVRGEDEIDVWSFCGTPEFDRAVGEMVRELAGDDATCLTF